MISGKDEIALYGTMGAGKLPLTGGPSGALRAAIGQTIPFEVSGSSAVAPSTGVMRLSSIFLVAGQTIANINYLSNGAESGGSHLWFAIYDDGRGSSSAGQLALLGQSLDQTGAAAFGATTNLGLALMVPFVTNYTGVYYLAVLGVASGMPTLRGISPASSASIQIGSSTGALFCGTAGSGLTNMAPNPSGAVSTGSFIDYAYVS